MLDKNIICSPIIFMTAATAEEIIFEKSSNTVFSGALAVYIIFIALRTHIFRHS